MMEKLNKLKNQKQELRAKIKLLNEELIQVESQERSERIKLNETKLNFLIENKDVILSLLEHSQTDCSDENPKNDDINRRGQYNCKKCFLTSIIDCHTDEYEVDFEVNFTKI